MGPSFRSEHVPGCFQREHKRRGGDTWLLPGDRSVSTVTALIVSQAEECAEPLLGPEPSSRVV